LDCIASHSLNSNFNMVFKLFLFFLAAQCMEKRPEKIQQQPQNTVPQQYDPSTMADKPLNKVPAFYTGEIPNKKFNKLEPRGTSAALKVGDKIYEGYSNYWNLLKPAHKALLQNGVVDGVAHSQEVANLAKQVGGLKDPSKFNRIKEEKAKPLIIKYFMDPNQPNKKISETDKFNQAAQPVQDENPDNVNQKHPFWANMLRVSCAETDALLHYLVEADEKGTSEANVYKALQTAFFIPERTLMYFGIGETRIFAKFVKPCNGGCSRWVNGDTGEVGGGTLKEKFLETVRQKPCGDCSEHEEMQDATSLYNNLSDDETGQTGCDLEGNFFSGNTEGLDLTKAKSVPVISQNDVTGNTVVIKRSGSGKVRIGNAMLNDEYFPDHHLMIIISTLFAAGCLFQYSRYKRYQGVEYVALLDPIHGDKA